MGKYRVQIIMLWIIVLLTQGLYVSALSPDSDVIVLTLWTELEKIPGGTGKDEISKAALEDAQWILSGMLYGFKVRYVPLDKDRHVRESLSVVPVVEIPFGDPALRVFKTWADNDRFYVQIRYNIYDYQQTRLKAWSSNIFPEASGTGTVSLFNGRSGRLDSIKEGIKNALRNYLRVKIRNKPREIDARVILDEPPYLTIKAGGYTARVRIKFFINKIVPYAVY